MSQNEESYVEENGVRLLLQKNHSNPTKSKTFYNPVMKICREFVLAALCTYCTEKRNENVCMKCLEAFGATGVAGLQWKKHLAERVSVTVNELDKAAVQSIVFNCQLNNIAPQMAHDARVDEKKHLHTTEEVGKRENSSAEKSSVTTSSEQLETLQQQDISASAPDKEILSTPNVSQCIEIVNGDANIIMHQRQFNFIHIDPFGTTVQFMAAAFRNIYHGGVLVLTSTDVAALFGKCPQVTQRNYGATAMKNDYMKEMAVRLVIGAAARSASQCNKGFEVLYSVAVEHFVQVAVRIKRGVSHADATLRCVHRILHCLMCEEWTVMPQARTLHNNPYSLLPCQCAQSSPGMTAVELGPAWCGEIFNSTFIEGMFQSAQMLKLSNRIKNLLSTISSESQCRKEEAVSGGQTEKTSGETGKRVLEGGSESVHKRLKGIRQLDICSVPMFYYNYHKRHFKHMDLPKINRLVQLLQAEGYIASRTHFDPNAVRTDATLSQLKLVLEKHCVHST